MIGRRATSEMSDAREVIRKVNTFERLIRYAISAFYARGTAFMTNMSSRMS